MKYKTLFALFLICSSLLYSDSVSLSTVEGLPLSDICSIILEKVYMRAGYDLHIRPMPPERASLEASSGRVHGETHRIEAYGASHPDLIRISVPIYAITVELYTECNNPARFSAREDLDQHRFTILRGVENSKILTSGFEHVQVVDDPGVMFELLKKGRTDFAVASNVFGERYLKKTGMEDIVTYETPLETTFLYHYLHKDYSDIASAINRTLEELSLSGELDQIRKAAEESVLGTD